MGTFFHKDELQKEDTGEGEALTLVEAALGQSRSWAKSWSCQPCAVKLWLFSGLPSVIFTPGREWGQLQTWRQSTSTQNKAVVLIPRQPCWLFWEFSTFFLFSVLITRKKNWL